MAIPIKDLFDLEQFSEGRPDSTQWHGEAFRRAYCVEENSTFRRVRDRVENGFSVLAFVPGSCMVPAAEYIKEARGGQGNWREFGHVSDQQIRDITDLWSESTSITTLLRSWWHGTESKYPQVVYHNLDFVGDGHGELIGGTPALTYCFSIMMATRTGTVVGLADREASRDIPVQLQRAFPEQIRLDAIEFSAFPRLIPISLGRALSEDDRELSVGAAWLIASRLRWSDPVRAVRIMDRVAKSVPKHDSFENRLKHALEAIWTASRVFGFDEPPPKRSSAIKGFDPKTLTKLDTNFVKPFQRWRNFRIGTGEVRAQQLIQRALESLPSGLIFYGPPGTGKTYLLQWLAEAIVLPIRIVNGAQVKAAGWGDAERNVHRLFREARRAAPCLLVFDDSDDLLPDRKLASGGLAGAERSVVQAFLQELEGFEGRPAGVLVALTSNLFASLDQAVRDKIGASNCIRIPFPLSKPQIAEIVDAMAEKFSYKLGEYRKELVDFFYGPVGPNTEFQENEDWRFKQDQGLYSARAIQHAMRELLPPDAPVQTDYPVNGQDVSRMKEHLGPEHARGGNGVRT